MRYERESGEGIERRSSGARFQVGPSRSYLRYSGVLACLAVLPLAIAASRLTGPGAQLVVADTVPITVLFSDSSRVILGPGSSLRFAPGFAHRRTLWLIGAARLNIVSGPTFNAWTETAVVRTAGEAASFDVRASGLETTFVAVSAGSVQLRALNEDNDPTLPPITLQAGQRGFSAKMVGAKRLP